MVADLGQEPVAQLVQRHTGQDGGRRTHRPTTPVVVDALADPLRDTTARDGLVFTVDGGPITRQVSGHLWRPVVKAAGLPVGTGFHALRHTSRHC